MAISKKMIDESKTWVLSTLEDYYKATPDELNEFAYKIDMEDKEDWTCGFDELLPTFLGIREYIIWKKKYTQ